MGLFAQSVAAYAAPEGTQFFVECAEFILAEAGELLVAADTQLVQSCREFLAHPLKHRKIVGIGGCAGQLLPGASAKNVARDIGRRGRDLVGEAVALRAVLSPRL